MSGYASYLERAARRYGDHVAVSHVETGETYSFIELDERATALAAVIVDRGVGVGDRVADLQWNSPRVAITDFAVARAGAVRVPLNARSQDEEIRRILLDTAPVALIIGPEFSERAVEIVRSVPSVRTIIGLQGTGGSSFDDLIDEGRALAPGITFPALDDTSMLSIKYTGGSTGVPRGVVRTHGAQRAAALNILLDLHGYQSDDRLLQVQPLSHGAGVFILPAVMRGTTQVMMSRFEPLAALRLIDENVVNCIKLVPTILFRLVEEFDAVAPDVSSLRSIISGAAPIPDALLKRAMDLFGPVVSQTYGQTEAPVTISTLSARDHWEAYQSGNGRLGSAGRAYTTVDLRIVDGSGVDQPRTEIGEILVRGPMNMTEYWKGPELQAVSRDEEWIPTGDIGYLDDEGYLFLKDRANDMIISGGFNVYPREIEDVLYSHPRVARAVVVGFPHPEWGEAVVALVVGADGLDLAELHAHCRTQLSPFKAPKAVVLVDDLPQIATGKIPRKTAREKLVAALDGQFPEPTVTLAGEQWTRTGSPHA